MPGCIGFHFTIWLNSAVMIRIRSQSQIWGHVQMTSWSANENAGKILTSPFLLFYYCITNIKLSHWLIFKIVFIYENISDRWPHLIKTLYRQNAMFRLAHSYWLLHSSTNVKPLLDNLRLKGQVLIKSPNVNKELSNSFLKKQLLFFYYLCMM